MERKEIWKAVGGRLAEARSKAGYSTQRLFAEALGLSEPAIAKYEQGVREVPIALLAFLSGRGINSGWIVTGNGEMFDDPSKAPKPSTAIDPWVMERLYVAAERVYKDMGRPISGPAIAHEATTLFNVLLTRVADLRDRPIVEAVIPVLRDELRERLLQAKPGDGKASAS